MFVALIQGRMKRDFEHQGEEVQDWAMYLEHFQSIFVDFKADYTLQEAQLGRIFYDNFCP